MYKNLDLRYKIILLISIFPIVLFKYLGLDILLNLLFFIIILGIFLFSLKYIYNNLNENYENLKKINKELEQNNGIDIEYIFKNKKDFEKIWEKYSSNFFENEETIKSEEYFNENTLIYSKINYKYISYIPNLFISIGIFGTFLGLVLGLDSISSIKDILGVEHSKLSPLISNLLLNVSTSFYTSLYGIYYSILFYILSNVYFDEFENLIFKLNKELFYLFSKNSSTERLKNISDILLKGIDTNINTRNIIVGELKNIEENILLKMEKSEKGLENNLQNIGNIIINKEKNIIKELKVIEDNMLLIDKKLKIVPEISDKLLIMIKTFEKELKQTLKKVFNEEYVTSMNEIQLQFISNSEELKKISDEQIDTLRKIEKLNKVIHKLNTNLEYVSTKFYTKEILENTITTFNEGLDNSKKTILEITEFMQKNMEIIGNTIREFRKDVKNNDFSKSLEITKNIISENRNMIESSSKYYNNMSIKEKEANLSLKNLLDRVDKLENKINESDEIFNHIIMKGKSIDQELNNSLIKYREEYNTLIENILEHYEKDEIKKVKERLVEIDNFINTMMTGEDDEAK